jgi:phenylalanyl-tRNA synthetase beta chain
MKISAGWIKERLRRTMLSDTDVVQALERAGIEVEQVLLSNEIDKMVVIALVKKVVQHPGADRLKLVDVETDEGEYRVVCGAPNVRQGLKVAFAQIGATLPGGEKIGKAKLRGEVSEGMLCSEFELKLGKDHNGIMELSTPEPVGTPLCDIYPSDTVIDVKTPANRFDVQSIVGLAREVAAMTSAELIPLAPPPVDFVNKDNVLVDGLVAQRYLLARVKVAQPAHSPLSIAKRLRAAGVRSIGPVVDVTNYVLLETGQPMHAFDAAKVVLPIAVRHARADEVLVTLDGVQRELTEADLVIADAQGPIGLAGLMGGQNSEVSADTTEVLLESAVFDGATIRKMAQRHGLRTEASARFERSIPVALPPLGMERAVELLGEIAGGELVWVAEQQDVKPERRHIDLPIERLSRLLGFGVSHKEAVAALEKLQIPATVILHKKDDSAVVSVPEVPWWRPDLKEPEDLVEEIVRVIGYDKVPSTIPLWRPRRIQFDRVRSVRRQVRDILWAAGAFEVMTYSFVSAEQLTDLGLDLAEHLKLKNPLSSEQAYLRSNLLPSHLATLERNRMYAKSVRFQEISNVFLKRGKAEQPDEPLRLGVTVLEPDEAYAVVKGILDQLGRALHLDLVVRPASDDVYAPGRYGEVWLGDARVGAIGQLHPTRVRAMKIDGEVAHFELDLAPLMAAAATRPYTPVSTFPTTLRDVTLLLPKDITWQAVREATAGWDVAFVGDYYGSELPVGMKGMTIRLRLSLPDRTPTEQEASELEDAVLLRLRHKFNVQLRN